LRPVPASLGLCGLPASHAGGPERDGDPDQRENVAEDLAGRLAGIGRCTLSSKHEAAESNARRLTAGQVLQLLTTCYAECMSVNVSVRLDDTLAERLRLRARAAGESLSDRLRRYAEEGSRRDEHPLITFRDGPTGRRAAVVGGPDVWEIIMWLEDLADEDDPARALAAEQDIARPLIDAALRYREAYPEEIEARIALHRHDTAAADAR
jgi:hypothetical protein